MANADRITDCPLDAQRPEKTTPVVSLTREVKVVLSAAMSLRRVVRSRFLAQAAVRVLGGAGGAGPVCWDQSVEENSSRSAGASIRCCGDSFPRYTLASAASIAESYPDPERDIVEFTEGAPCYGNAPISRANDSERQSNDDDGDEITQSGLGVSEVERPEVEHSVEMSAQREEGEPGGGRGSNLESELASSVEGGVGCEQEDGSTRASTSARASGGGGDLEEKEEGFESLDWNRGGSEAESVPSEPSLAGGDAGTTSQQRPAPTDANSGMRTPSSRAEMLRNPFMYESHILKKLTTAERIRAVQEAMDEGEHVNPSFFGYVFLHPSSLEDLLKGIEIMQQHLRSTKDDQKGQHYVMASRFFIPWLVKFNQVDLLFKILEDPKEYGVARVQGALTGAVKIWRLAGRIDLLERAMNLLMDQGDKLNTEFIRATLESYLNAGLFQEAQAFRKKILSKGWRVPMSVDTWMDQVLRGRRWVVVKNFAWQMRPNGTVNMRVGPAKKRSKDFAVRPWGMSKKWNSFNVRSRRPDANQPRNESDARGE